MNALALLSHTMLSIAGPRFLLGITERATTLSGGGARLFFVGMFSGYRIGSVKFKSSQVKLDLT